MLSPLSWELPVLSSGSTPEARRQQGVGRPLAAKKRVHRQTGRAQARAPFTRAPASAGTKRSALLQISGIHETGSGSSARKVDPTETSPSAATRLNRDPGTPARDPPTTSSTPAC